MATRPSFPIAWAAKAVLWLPAVALACAPVQQTQHETKTRYAAALSYATRANPSMQGQLSIRAGVLPKANPPQETPSLLGDCNDDGLLDIYQPRMGLLLVQDGQGNFAQVAQFNPNPPPNEGVKIVLSSPVPRYSSGAFADIDGDGKLDILAAGIEQDLYLGLGDCKFGPAQRLPKPCVTDPPTQVFVTDVDLDGLPDLSESCASPDDGPVHLLLGRGDGSFESVLPPPTPFIKKATDFEIFGTLYDDVDGDGTLDGFFLAETNTGWFSWGEPGDLPSFQRDDDVSHGTSDRDGMSTTALDYDRDGHMDYFLGGTTFGDILLHNEGPRYLRDVAAHSGMPKQDPLSSWSSYALDLDLDGWQDLIVMRTGPPDYSALPAVYVNRHDGTFINLATQLLPPGTLIGTMEMTCGDLAGTGRITCLAPGSPDRDTLFLSNDIQAKGGWIGVRLAGTVSASEGRGARVSLLGDTRPLTLVAGGQTPTFCQDDPAVVLAVGSRTSVDLQVEWPSGIVQTISGLPAGAYARIEEPRALSVSRRVVAADGTGQVDVVLDPAAAGASDASVDVEGAGTWAGPLAPGSDGKLHRTLLAPPTPGSARIVATFGGKPLRVRPRVRFE